jgi:hypothetical protein
VVIDSRLSSYLYRYGTDTGILVARRSANRRNQGFFDELGKLLYGFSASCRVPPKVATYRSRGLRA